MTSQAKRFLEDIKDVCREYEMILDHEDGFLVIKKLKEEEDLRFIDAAVDWT